jgi:hypothetical protein
MLPLRSVGSAIVFVTGPSTLTSVYPDAPCAPGFATDVGRFATEATIFGVALKSDVPTSVGVTMEYQF